MGKLLTTSEAARIVGVGASSVKRWADEGVLDCIRTAGGHRRFTRDAVSRFLRVRRQEETIANEVDRWIDTLLSEVSPELALVRARGRLGSWRGVAEELDPVLVEIGNRWAREEVTVAEEHIAAERLSRSLARISESLPLPAGAPRCLLACVETEEHTLGLGLAEVCMRELGWGSVWLGSRSPANAIAERVRSDVRIQLVGLSASEACLDPSLLRRAHREVATVCRESNVALAVGGRGPWPDPLSYGTRIVSFDSLGILTEELRGGPVRWLRTQR